MDLSPLRLNNIFDDDSSNNESQKPVIQFLTHQGAPEPPSAIAALPETSKLDAVGKLINTWKPQTDVRDAYKEHLANMPERPAPSSMDKLAGSIAMMGAGAGAQGAYHGSPLGFRYNPTAANTAKEDVEFGDYDRELQDWSNKAKALGLGAQVEEKYNNDMRLLATSQGNLADKNARTVAIQQNADTRTAGAASLDAHRKAQDAFALLKQQHTGVKFVQDESGQWNAMLPDGTSKLVTDEDENPVTGLSPEDAISLKTQGTLANTALRNKGNLDTQGLRNKGALETVDERGKQTRQTNAEKPDKTNKPQSATQEKAAISNRIQHALIDHPEWSKYFAKAGGAWVVKDSSWFGTGGDDVKAIQNYLQGGSSITQNKPIQLTSPDGAVHDISTWSDNDIAQAKLHGYH